MVGALRDQVEALPVDEERIGLDDEFFVRAPDAVVAAAEAILVRSAVMMSFTSSIRSV